VPRRPIYFLSFFKVLARRARLPSLPPFLGMSRIIISPKGIMCGPFGIFFGLPPFGFATLAPLRPGPPFRWGRSLNHLLTPGFPLGGGRSCPSVLLGRLGWHQKCIGKADTLNVTPSPATGGGPGSLGAKVPSMR